MNKNLRIRFAVYFCLTMLAASLITSGAMYLYMATKLGSTVRENQQSIAETLMAIDTDSQGALVDNGDIGSYEVYSVHRLDPKGEYVVKNRERLDSGEIITEDNWLVPTISSTFFAVGGQYYQISLFPNTTVTWQLIASLLTSVISAILLGTLFAAFAGKRFLRPIREMSRATEEVAKGNFDVRVSAPKNAELGILVSNFNKMTRDLGSTETLQREFISNVSHEFKTPLASINGFARLLQSDGLSDEQRKEYADIIAEESERLARLSASILRLSKLENTSVITETSEFSLDEQLRRIIALLAPEWSQKDIEMNIELDEANILSSEQLLSEVWVNLLTNAIKFTPRGGQIWVRLAEGLDNVIVEIEDDGCGMSEAVRRRIFEKFYQGDRSHAEEGNGLGLALVKRIIELCGGRIEVESIEGEGSLFRVILNRDM